MSDRDESLSKVYNQWSTADLIRAIEQQHADYTVEALALMVQILRDRQIPAGTYEKKRAEVEVEDHRRAGPKWEEKAFRVSHPLKSFLASRRTIFSTLCISVCYLVFEVTLLKLKIITESPVWVALFWLSFFLLFAGACGAIIRYRNLYPRIPLSFSVYIFYLLAGIPLSLVFLAISETLQPPLPWSIVAFNLFYFIIPTIMAPLALAGILSLKREGWKMAIVHRSYVFVITLIVLVLTAIGALIKHRLGIGLTPIQTYLFLIIFLSLNGYWLSVLQAQKSLFR